MNREPWKTFLSTRQPEFQATQVTDEWFDDEHPNPLHIVDVWIDPVKRYVRVPTPRGIYHIAKSDDWIVKTNDENYGDGFRVFSNEEFVSLYVSTDPAEFVATVKVEPVMMCDTRENRLQPLSCNNCNSMKDSCWCWLIGEDIENIAAGDRHADCPCTPAIPVAPTKESQ
jgi:hypothetical protein